MVDDTNGGAAGAAGTAGTAGAAGAAATDPAAGGAAGAAGGTTDDAAAKAAADKAAADKAAADAGAQTAEQKAAAEKAATEKAAADKAAADAQAEKDAKEAKDKALHTPPADGKYNLTLPKDATLDATALERTAAIARELGLSNDAAQKLVESTNAEVAQYLTAEHAKFEAAAAEWKQSVLADPRYGKTPEERAQAIDRGRQVIDVHFAKVNPEGAQAIKGFLNDTLYGNHPAVVSLMHWLGQQGKEGPLVLPTPDSGTGKMRDVDIFYPKGAGLTEAEIAAAGST